MTSSPDYDLAAAMALILWPTEVRTGVNAMSERAPDTASTFYNEVVAPKLGLPRGPIALWCLIKAAERLINDQREQETASPPAQEAA